jgi:hypothetical protein
MIPTVIAPHPDQPLPASGEGRRSVALAGWGSSGLISNQADMILPDATRTAMTPLANLN